MQVTEPLRAMVVGSPLEDARHLAHKYDRVRQDVEAQVITYVVYEHMNNQLLILPYYPMHQKNYLAKDRDFLGTLYFVLTRIGY